MKRFLSTIVAFIYLSTSMGATVHLHYCMGKLVAWALYDSDSKNCMSCGMPKNVGFNNCEISSKNCCKEELKQIKTDKDQQAPPNESQTFKLSPIALSFAYGLQQDFYISSFAIQYPNANAPPRAHKVAAFLLHRNFRI